MKINFVWVLLLIEGALIRTENDLNAILLSTSKFWFNYRQGANSLIIYNRLRDNGVKDSNVKFNYFNLLFLNLDASLTS